MSDDPIIERLVVVEKRAANIDVRTANIENKVAIIDDRQERMHSDMTALTESNKLLNTSLQKLTVVFENKRGFIAGLVTAFSIIGALMGAFLTALWDRIIS